MIEDRVYPKLKSQFTKMEPSRFEIRLRTPEEQEEYLRERAEAERQRTKDFLLCCCCDRRKPPGDYLLKDMLVCCDCVDRGQRYGRPWRTRVRVPQQPTQMWFLNAAMALVKEIDRECRNTHRNYRPMAVFQPILTLSNSPKL